MGTISHGRYPTSQSNTRDARTLSWLLRLEPERRRKRVAAVARSPIQRAQLVDGVLALVRATAAYLSSVGETRSSASAN